MNSKQSRASIYMAFGMLTMGNSVHVSAQEDTSTTTAPHTFESGDVISAEQMNNNFSAIFDAIAEIKAASGTQGETGPIGPTGSTGPAGIGIKDAGTFAGSVDTETSGGNFSLLPGAGGATGVAAADAACEVNYLGSHAELDPLALWKSGVDGELVIGFYWSSSETDVPVSDFNLLTTSCDDWTNNQNGSTASETDRGNIVGVESDTNSNSKIVRFHWNECHVGSNPSISTAGDPTVKIACYNDQ